MTPLQRSAWVARAAMTSYVRKVDATIARIAEGARGYAVSVSWGKDSVVMLSLAAEALGRVTAIHGRYSQNEELPDIPHVRDAILGRLGAAVDYAEVPVWGDWELYERAGRFFLTPESAEEHRLLAEWKRDFVAAIEGKAMACGAAGMMIGMAGHESHGRRMNIAVRGDAYQAQGRLPTLLPLARWSADDICAWHVAGAVPWLQIYDQANDPRTARSEFAFACGAGDATRRHGGWEDWKAAYPALFRTWQKRWSIA